MISSEFDSRYRHHDRSKMKELFIQRKLVGSKLKEYIRNSGYTKASFSSKANISKIDLEKILNGENDDESVFVSIMTKILKVLNTTEKEILSDEISSYTKVPEFTKNNMNEKAKKQYDLLLDIIDLCAIYY